MSSKSRSELVSNRYTLWSSLVITAVAI